MRKFLFIAIILSFIGCNYIKQPTRLKNIPADAFWSGGSDGGFWFLIEKSNEKNKTIHFKIYNDHSGDIVADKDFKLQCEPGTKFNWSEIPDLIDWYDLTKIWLDIRQKKGTTCYFE